MPFILVKLTGGFGGFLTNSRIHENRFEIRCVYLMLINHYSMKQFLSLVGVSFLFFISCKSDDAAVCSTCSSEITSPFELCEESNGNASVNGQDTGVDYNIYMEGLVSEGVSCN